MFQEIKKNVGDLWLLVNVIWAAGLHQFIGRNAQTQEILLPSCTSHQIWLKFSFGRSPTHLLHNFGKNKPWFQIWRDKPKNERPGKKERAQFFFKKKIHYMICPRAMAMFEYAVMGPLVMASLMLYTRRQGPCTTAAVHNSRGWQQEGRRR